MGGAPDREAVERMAATMDSRGPDSVGAWSDGQLAVAYRRLAVIDTESSGDQPMVDHDNGITIVFHGAIYNHDQLRHELGREGFSFFSSSDTEVVLKAHDHWGPRCTDAFVGEFAYVLFEHYSGRLFLARDRLGVKPLYLAELDGAVRFASTIPALLAGGGIDTELDPVALHHYLTWHGTVPAPRTIVAGVRKLEPATVTIITPDGRRVSENYWRPDYARYPRFKGWSVERWAEEFRYDFYTALERRMVADVPVAISLSGGLESRLMLPFLVEGGNEGLNTFSVGADETALALAQQFQTEHLSIEVSEDDLPESLAGAVSAMSEPVARDDAIATYLIAKALGSSYKVIQSGLGAADVFAAHRQYAALLGAGAGAADAYASRVFDRTHAEITAALQATYQLEEDPSRALLDWHFRLPGAEELVDRALRFDIDALLAADRLSVLDSMATASGLEVRSPYLDYEVVELMAACPPELKARDGGRAILEAAARDFVPEAAIDAPPTPSVLPAFPGPDLHALPSVREALAAAGERGVFRPEYIERLLAAPEEDRTPLGGSKLWPIALLELWLRANGL